MPSMPWRVTMTGISSADNNYPTYFPDYLAQRPFNYGVGVVLGSTASTNSYSVQHTFDYTGSSAFLSSNATWFNNTGMTALSCSLDGNYAFPVTAIRLNSTGGSTAVAVTITIVQAG